MSERRSRADAIDAVTGVFRDNGYEGASLSDLAGATGLGRSSLYHYFPGGKADMAAASLEAVNRSMEGLSSDLDAMPSARDRWTRLAGHMNEFYVGGRKPCLLGAFATGLESLPQGPALARAFRLQQGLFEGIALAAGASPQAAVHRAEDAVSRLQGGLIAARALDDPQRFARTLADIGEALLKS
jgi:AcrR family transcriptional regulator